MTLEQGIIILFVLLIGGMALPVPHGFRTALFVALVAYSALVLVGGGMEYLLSMFQ